VVSSLNFGLTEKREHNTILATYFFLLSIFLVLSLSIRRSQEKNSVFWLAEALPNLLELLMNLFMSN
jgi:hypothetical protein